MYNKLVKSYDLEACLKKHFSFSNKKVNEDDLFHVQVLTFNLVIASTNNSDNNKINECKRV